MSREDLEIAATAARFAALERQRNEIARDQDFVWNGGLVIAGGLIGAAVVKPVLIPFVQRYGAVISLLPLGWFVFLRKQ